VYWGWKYLIGEWKFLAQEKWIDQFVEAGLFFIAIVLVVRLINRGLMVVLDRSLRRLGKEKQLTLLQGLQPMIRTVVWILGLLVFLQSQGVALGAIYASLAGAGIGIGLALKGPITNFINYLTILIDEPFQIGHFVTFDDVLGTVERVGIRSSSIRSLSGERIEISNEELLNKTISNFGDLPKRRVAAQIGVIYQTPVEKVAAIPGLIEAVISNTPQAEYDRCHFIRFADSALLFEFVYFIPDQDMVVFLDAQHAINLGIMKRFEQEGIDFAYPTRTLFIEQSDAGSGDSAASDSPLPQAAAQPRIAS
jgi:small-conductance mechanosensitive channel